MYTISLFIITCSVTTIVLVLELGPKDEGF